MTEWLNGLVGEALAPYVSFAIALIIVLLLIAILFRIIKAFTMGKFGTAHQNRLGIVEGMALEGKRRLVIVRRDNVEHLILIGGENDLVIEQGIIKQAAQSPAMTSKPAAASKPATAAAPSTTTTPPAAPPVVPKPATTAAPSTATTPPAAPPVAPKPATAAAPSTTTTPPAAPPVAPKPATAAAPAPAASQPTSNTSGNAAQPASSAVKPTHTPPTSNDSAKIKEMNRLLDQIAGD